jgi:hypothetical protein
MSDSVVQYGVIYPDGTEDWNVTSWFGLIDEPGQQESFRTMYTQRLSALGVTSAPADLKFMRRKANTTYTYVTDITEEIAT